MTTLFLFILGLCMGSFLNVLADRLPAGEWPTGRSKCDWCGRVLAAGELVPVVSWAWLRAKSACCRKRLSMWYPAVEVGTGLVYVWLWSWVTGGGGSLAGFGVTILTYVLFSALIVIVVADFKYHIIPDAMTALVTLAALGQLVLAGASAQIWTQHILGALAMSGGLYALYAVTRGRGLGLGDVKFAFPMGLILGPVGGAAALYVACILGGVYGVAALLARRAKLKSEVAFGPFLVTGLIVMMVWRPAVMAFFGRLF